jgi:hypothetical protein
LSLRRNDINTYLHVHRCPLPTGAGEKREAFRPKRPRVKLGIRAAEIELLKSPLFAHLKVQL